MRSHLSLSETKPEMDGSSSPNPVSQSDQQPAALAQSAPVETVEITDVNSFMVVDGTTTASIHTQESRSAPKRSNADSILGKRF